MKTVSAIQHLPAKFGKGRVETGTVQFGDDWPGVFIRGDNAAYYALMLAYAKSDDPIADIQIRDLKRLLEGCIVGPAPQTVEAKVEEPNG